MGQGGRQGAEGDHGPGHTHLNKSPQQDKARKRTLYTSATVEETEQWRTTCLAEGTNEKLIAENPQLAMARKKKAPDEADKSNLVIQRQLAGEIAQERPRPSNPPMQGRVEQQGATCRMLAAGHLWSASWSHYFLQAKINGSQRDCRDNI